MAQQCKLVGELPVRVEVNVDDGVISSRGSQRDHVVLHGSSVVVVINTPYLTLTIMSEHLLWNRNS